MPTTPELDLPYPSATDPADVPKDLQALAERLEAIATAPPMGKVQCPAHNPGPNAVAIIPMTADFTPAQMQGGMVKSGGGLQVPVDGLYNVSTGITLDGGSPSGRYDFGINNMTRNANVGGMDTTDGGIIYYFTSGTYTGPNFSTVVACSAGDVIAVVEFTAVGASAIYGGGFTWLAVSKAG